INLLQLKPNPVALLSGFIPRFDKMDFSDTEGNLQLLGLMGTTFVISAAFYQAYLVHQKGWGLKELQSGMTDARIGSVIMALITVMLMSTAAAGIYTGDAVTLKNPVEVA